MRSSSARGQLAPIMPSIDLLAFDIAFALMRKTGGATKKLIRSLSEKELDCLAATIAEHLLLCGWRQRAADPSAKGDQFLGGLPR